jgi:hypothetical protein
LKVEMVPNPDAALNTRFQQHISQISQLSAPVRDYSLCSICIYAQNVMYSTRQRLLWNDAPQRGRDEVHDEDVVCGVERAHAACDAYRETALVAENQDVHGKETRGCV